jgi:hypothetical protein
VLAGVACATRNEPPDATSVAGGSGAPNASAQQPVRINRERLLADIQTLSADSFGGRRVGTPGGRKGRAYVEVAMRGSGARPFGSSYVQPFTMRARDSSAVDAANVVGVVRGTRHPGRYIVVSGHYDHLAIRSGAAGDSIFNGADDNASGTSAMLELARYFAAHPPENSMIFAGFDAEESGLRGARAFVANPPVPVDSIIMNVNMDMVSRSEKGELYAVGTLAFPVLKPFVERAQGKGRVTLLTGHEGPNARGTDNWTGASDHGAFGERRIPYIYFGVEDHADYHRVSDEFRNISPDFYVRVVETVLDFLLDVDRNLDPIAAARRAGP